MSRGDDVIQLPGGDADWTSAERVVRDAARAHIGKNKIEVEPADSHRGDFSLVPVERAERWSGADRFGDLLDSCTGQTTATYISGCGLFAQSVVDQVTCDVEAKISEMVDALNPEIDDAAGTDRGTEYVIEQASELISDFRSDRLGELAARYVVRTCHDGTDWCVVSAAENEDPDGVFDALEDALARGREIVREQNAARKPGVSPSQFWDFSGESHRLKVELEELVEKTRSPAMFATLLDPAGSIWSVFWDCPDGDPARATLTIYCDEDCYCDEGNHHLHDGATASDVLAAIRSEYNRCSERKT